MFVGGKRYIREYKRIGKCWPMETFGKYRFKQPQRVTNKLDPKRTTPRHTVIKLPKVKDKERILKAARQKQRVTYTKE